MEGRLMQNKGPKLVRSALPYICWCLCLAPLSAAYSQERPKIINFEEVDARHDRVVAKKYLAKYGITINEVSNGTLVVIVNARNLYDGRVLVPSSGTNMLAQINISGFINECVVGVNDQVSFRLNLSAPMQTVQFTRPELLAGPTGITFPEWRAMALDETGEVLDEVGEPLGGGTKYYSNVPAHRFMLKGLGIRAVRFNSKYYCSTAFSAVVIDDLTLDPTGIRP
jgi:hypothetical protein